MEEIKQKVQLTRRQNLLPFKRLVWWLAVSFYLTFPIVSSSWVMAVPRMVIIPYLLQGDGLQSGREADIDVALRWLVEREYRVELLSFDRTHIAMRSLGLDSQSRWNAANAGDLLQNMDAQLLLLASAVKGEKQLYGKVSIIKRVGLRDVQVVYRKKILVQDQKRNFDNDQQTKNHLLSPDSKIDSGQPLQTDDQGDLEIYHQFIKALGSALSEYLPAKKVLLSQQPFAKMNIDVAWVIDNSGSMYHHRQEIENGMRKIWLKVDGRSGISLRYAIISVNSKLDSSQAKKIDFQNDAHWRDQLAALRYADNISGSQVYHSLANTAKSIPWNYQQGHRLAMFLSDGGWYESGEVSYHSLFPLFKQNSISVISIAMPGMSSQELQLMRSLSAQSQGESWSVISYARGFKPGQYKQLACYEGYWFEYNGQEQLDAEKVQDLRQALANQASTFEFDKNPAQVWTSVGYLAVKNPQSIWQQSGDFKQYQPLEQNASGYDTSIVIERAFNQWLAQRHDNIDLANQQAILVRNGELTQWLSLPSHLSKLNHLIRQARIWYKQKQQIWLVASIEQDINEPLGFRFNASNLDLLQPLAQPPSLYQTDLSKLAANSLYYSQNGLGENNLWFIKVLIVQMPENPTSVDQGDLRDF